MGEINSLRHHLAEKEGIRSILFSSSGRGERKRFATERGGKKKTTIASRKNPDRLI